MSGAAFSRRGAWILGAVMGVSLVTFLGVWVFGGPSSPEGGTRHVLDSTFSRSAVGHAAFRELLERLDVPVTVSRFRSGERSGDSSVLLLLEPHQQSGDADVESLQDSLERGARVLLVLPKWDARRDQWRPERVESPVPAHPVETVEQWLKIAKIQGRVVRPGTLDVSGEGFPVPRLSAPQLVVSGELEPVVAGPDGILLGKSRGHSNQLWVLSDPDVIENHGLVMGDNAAFAVRVLERVAGGRLGPVVIDETHHGYVQPPQVFRALFEFPLVVAVLHVVLLIGIVAWAGSGRFGPPRPEQIGLKAGKDVLISNMAKLLLVGTRSATALTKYFRNAVANVALRTGGEAGATPREQVERLARIGEGRKVSLNVAELEDRVRDLAGSEKFEEGRAIRLARDIHRWQKEFLDGA